MARIVGLLCFIGHLAFGLKFGASALGRGSVEICSCGAEFWHLCHWRSRACAPGSAKADSPSPLGAEAKLGVCVGVADFDTHHAPSITAEEIVEGPCGSCACKGAPCGGTRKVVEVWRGLEFLDVIHPLAAPGRDARRRQGYTSSGNGLRTKCILADCRNQEREDQKVLWSYPDG